MPQIRCRKETSTYKNYCRLVVTVTQADELDPNIFLYLALPIRAGAEDQEAQFQGVCSPHDMVDYPVGEPYPSAEPPWLRWYEVDMLFPSQKEADAAWTLIQQEITRLCLVIQSLETLTQSEVLDFGTSEPGNISWPG